MKQHSLTSCFYKVITVLFALAIFEPHSLKAQAVYQPYSYHFYQKLNKIQYSTGTRQHTAIKPLIIDSVLRPRYDSLMNIGVKEQSSWLSRKIFNEHLIEVNTEHQHFYADILPDVYLGRDFAGGGKNTFLRTIGVQLGGTVDDKFYYHFSAYNNRSIFPNYVNEYINQTKVVPGQTYGDVGETVQDWNYLTAVASYTPTRYLSICLAYEWSCIGDGYRSMLLSDVPSNYTSVKLAGKRGSVQYLSMWSFMIDPLAPKLLRDKTRGKWGTFQYLDWNVNNRLSLGFFQSIIWANRTENDGVRGFEPNYLNPIIFLRPIESSDPSSPDKMHLGLNAKYKVLNNLAVYGQFLLGEFTSKEFFAGNGYIHNKWGAQLGLRGFNTFGVENLNFLGEVNLVRPYTYSHYDPISNYSHFSQPLAHPLGANFREFVGIANYSFNKFDVSIQGNYAAYGLDPDADTNYGKDIFKSYNDFENIYNNQIAQGVSTKQAFLDAKVSYILNPKYNLRIELGVIARQEINDLSTRNSGMLTFGLRSSFRNLYYDF